MLGSGVEGGGGGLEGQGGAGEPWELGNYIIFFNNFINFISIEPLNCNILHRL